MTVARTPIIPVNSASECDAICRNGDVGLSSVITKETYQLDQYVGLLVRAAPFKARPPNTRGIEADSLMSRGCDSSILFLCAEAVPHSAGPF